MSRLVVVSNRVPVPSTAAHAGGLAVALDGLMERRGGLWFGWSGGISSEASDSAIKIVHAGGVDYATVDLTQDEHDRYYNNFSNGVLWPLLHTMPELMRYDRVDARSYRDVNARFSECLQTLLHPSDVVWVHDYHLLPMAASLRARGVKNPIGLFLHIPFASSDVLAAAPEMAAFVRDMLAADLIGFQTENDLTNFANAAELLAGASRSLGNLLNVTWNGESRRVRLGVFPVEIEPHSFARMAADMENGSAAINLRRSLLGQKLILGVERLDPTKGLLQRVQGLRALLEHRPAWRRHVTMLQIAATSRKEVQSYQALRTALDRETGALNADLGDPDWTPVRLVSRGVDRNVVAGYLRHAEVGMVTPLRDGMNLVAKEFVAAQDPANPGVLVLSRFAGAARQRGGAGLGHPYDAAAMGEAGHTALSMPLGERLERWQSLWAAIENRSPLAWGRSFVAALMRGTPAAPTFARQLSLEARAPLEAMRAMPAASEGPRTIN